MRIIASILLSTALLVTGFPIFAAESQSNISTKWDNAKNSTQKALQQSKEAGSAIWEASKESSQEIWSDSKEMSEQVWDDVKEKSATVVEKGQTLLKKGSDKMGNLLENEAEEVQPENTDIML
ncbi:hypothetical protein ACR30L_07655 [Psychromonas sp. PT13]|uniref:hypothetical protein n=1 Tax=Psychromonas sp. PT13 TaxID=3439547 RepID=UPI003EBEC171